jgi:hypothetical protein
VIVARAPDVLTGRIDETRHRCAEAVAAIEREGIPRDGRPDSVTLMTRVRQFASDQTEAARALAHLGDDARDRMNAVRRALLVAALGAIDRLDGLPVSTSVKLRFCEIFQRLCRPPRGLDPTLRPDRDFQGRALAQCTLLRRFPAGQLDWEVSGVPRSYLVRIPWRDIPRVLGAVASRTRGLRPMFVAHMGLTRYSLLFLEVESLRSYYRIAESMALQPEIRGLMMASWYHSVETIAVSPHLAWTNRTPLSYGAVLTHIGPASPDDGFLVGSRERQRLFDSGRYRPRTGMLIWARRDLLRWAAAHPEYAAE